MTATASSIATTRIDKTAAFFIAQLVLEAVTHLAVARSVIYGRSRTRLVQGKRRNSAPEIELNG
jgi:hypothetical protein